MRDENRPDRIYITAQNIIGKIYSQVYGRIVIDKSTLEIEPYKQVDTNGYDG